MAGSGLGGSNICASSLPPATCNRPPERTSSGITLPPARQTWRTLFITSIAALAISVQAVRGFTVAVTTDSGPTNDCAHAAMTSADSYESATEPNAVSDYSGDELPHLYSSRDTIHDNACDLLSHARRLLQGAPSAAPVTVSPASPLTIIPDSTDYGQRPAAAAVSTGLLTAATQQESQVQSAIGTRLITFPTGGIRGGLAGSASGNSEDWGLRAATQLPLPPSPPSRAKNYTTSGQGYLEYDKGPALNVQYDFNSLIIDDMDDMVVTKGYPIQRHITYSEGYKLVTFRIPYGANGPTGAARASTGTARHPVILLHGISLSSTCWVVNSPSQSLGFILADKGYDVWMINTRGNTFSREHEQYTTADSQFWMFSMDDLALTDLPNVITYVKQVTGAAMVSLVGHSQGGTIATAMLSRPSPEGGQYPVDVLVNVAPVIFVPFMKSIMLDSFCVQTNSSALLAGAPPQEFVFMSKSFQDMLLNGVCQQAVAVPICRGFTEAMFGSSFHITTLQYKRYWQVWPSATSFWNALQWSQLYSAKPPVFRQFNGGPVYDLTKITTPVVMITGGNDVLSTSDDMTMTMSQLRVGGSLRGYTHLKDYSHMDHIWDTLAANDCYPAILRALQQFGA